MVFCTLICKASSFHWQMIMWVIEKCGDVRSVESCKVGKMWNLHNFAVDISEFVNYYTRVMTLESLYYLSVILLS